MEKALKGIADEFKKTLKSSLEYIKLSYKTDNARRGAKSSQRKKTVFTTQMNNMDLRIFSRTIIQSFKTSISLV